MSKPASSLELSDPVVIGIPLGRRPAQSDRYSQVRADRSGTLSKPAVRRVMGIELPQSSSHSDAGAWSLINRRA